MKLETCPNDAELKAHLLGQSTGDEANAIDEHLQSCDVCVNRADGLNTEDPLMSALGNGPAEIDGDEEVVSAIIEKASTLNNELDSTNANKKSASKSTSDLDLSFLNPSLDEDELGRLGPFRILEVLGVGGMGVVLKAEDPNLIREVALKVMKPEIAAGTIAKQRFLREARATAAIEHDNIVTIHQVDEDGGVPYLAMPFLKGESLRDRVKREKKLPVRDILKIAKEVASGLAAAHAAGLIHRDIKPDNIWLEDRTPADQSTTNAKSGKYNKFRVKIVDFGLARADDDINITQSGAIMGTPRYMSPEQANGEVADHRTDLFSLGGVLYHLATGRGPFDRKSLPATLFAVMNDEAEPVSKLRNDLPEELSELIDRLLKKNLADRPQSADEVVNVINQILKDRITKSTVQMPPKKKSSSSISKTSTTKLQPARRKPGFNPLLIGLAALVPIFLVWGIVLLFDTPEGTLRVEVNGDDIEVLVDGSTVKLKEGKAQLDKKAKFHDLTLKLAGVEIPFDKTSKQFELEEGKISVEVGDAKLTAPKFEVTKNKTTVLRIDFKPNRQVVQHLQPKPKPHSTSPYSGKENPAKAPAPAIAPFTAEEAKQHQAAWAKYLNLPVEKEIQLANGTVITMVLVPPGEFTMGSTAEQVQEFTKLAETAGFDLTSRLGFESPSRRVRLTQPFYMSKTEITQAQYQTLMGDNPASFKLSDSHPVEMISWSMAQEFLKELNKKHPQQDATFQLPTEAQWEFACRAGTTGAFSPDVTLQDFSQIGWSGSNGTGSTHPVAKLRPNAFGLYDMHGNVLEWCSDNYVEYEPVSVTLVNPTGPSSSRSRVNRGGDWNYHPLRSRSSARSYNSPSGTSNRIGIRMILPVDAEKESQRAITQNGTTGWYGWPADAPPPAIAPFTAEEAKQHQTAWAKYLKLPVEYENSIGMKFHLLPPGEFMMGSTTEHVEHALRIVGPHEPWKDAVRNEAPQHKVILTKPLYVGTTEVTQKHYEQIMGKNPSFFSVSGGGKDKVANMDTDNFPVETVDWNDAAEFCSKLCQHEKLKPWYFRSSKTVTPLNGIGYRLPTEAEWEFACRAGTTTHYWPGDRERDLNTVGWTQTNSGGRMHAVGELKANPFGLFDVHGNAREWIQDGWDPTSYERFSKSPAIDPVVPFTKNYKRILRGGYGLRHAALCRSAIRILDPLDNKYQGLGFRVVLPYQVVLENMTNVASDADWIVGSWRAFKDKHELIFQLEFRADGTCVKTIPQEVVEALQQNKMTVPTERLQIGLWEKNDDGTYSTQIEDEAISQPTLVPVNGAVIAKTRNVERYRLLRIPSADNSTSSQTSIPTKVDPSASLVDRLKASIQGNRLPLGEGNITLTKEVNLVTAVDLGDRIKLMFSVGEMNQQITFNKLKGLNGVYQPNQWKSRRFITTQDSHIESLIRRGLLTVEFDPKLIKKKPATTEPASERAIAERIFELGGGVSFVNKKQKNAYRIADLPKDDFVINHVGYANKYLTIGREHILVLSGLSHLETLYFGQTKLTDAAIDEIAKLKDLKELYVKKCNFNNAHLAKLKTLPKLEMMELFHTELTNDGLKTLAEFPALRRLTLENASKAKFGDPIINDAGLVHLANCKKLEVFWLMGPNFTDAAVEHLVKIKSLKVLNIGAHEITEKGFEDLKKRIHSSCRVTLASRLTNPGNDQYLPRSVPMSNFEEQGTVIDTKVGTNSMAVSPDGKLIATSSDDELEKINIWDANTGKLISQFRSPGDFTSVPFRLDFSPDSKSLLMAVQNQVAVVSATDGKLEKSFDFPTPPKLVVFPKQTLALAVYHEKPGHRTELGDIPQYLRIWNWKTGNTLLEEKVSMDRGTIRSASISPDERFLITCRQNYANKIELKLDGEKASLGKSVDFEYVNRIRSKMVFSNDGKYAAFSIKGKGGMAAIFDAETRQVLHLVDPETAKEENGGYVYGCYVVFTNDGSSYFTSDHTGRIAQWDTKTGKLIRVVGYLKTSGQHITPRIAITKDNRVIVAGGEVDPRIVILK